jgi:CubicO group peptidase (beta-lactamase class C family)
MITGVHTMFYSSQAHRWLLCSAVVLYFGVGSPAQTSGQRPADPTGRFSAVHQLLEDYVRQSRVAGAVGLVMERGRLVYSDAAGWRDLAAKKPMAGDTIFRIASMTKPVTSVAVMVLVDEGRVSLSDPLSKFIPEFATQQVIKPTPDGAGQPVAASRPITIRDLLTHTSGITYGLFGQQPHAERYKAAGVSDGLIETPATLAENMRRLATCPLTNQPGEAWQYGLSTDVLGRVVEVASGKRLDEFFAERIFQPLGMRDTHFRLPAEKRDRLATLYRPGAGQKLEAVGSGPQQAAGLIYSATFVSDSSPYLSAGAGLVSTAADYARFLSMLLGRGELEGVRLLEPETVDEMTRNQIGDLSILFGVHGDRFGYGFGVHTEKSDRNGASIGSYSWGGIFHTYFWVDPKRQVIGIVLAQLYPFDQSALWSDFQKQVYESLDATVPSKQARGPQPGEVYREFAVHTGGNRGWRVTDPNAADPRSWEFLPNPEPTITVDDLQDAIRAEVLIDRWGGHLRTTRKQIRFNQRPWLVLPELTTTPAGRAEHYYSQDNPSIEVPLEHLRQGVNTLEGSCSGLDGFRWGQWGLYSALLRIYYDPAKKEHPAASIVAPSAGSTVGSSPTIELRCSDGVAHADVLAWYEGDDENGDGVYADWHGGYHQPEKGSPAELRGHAGSIAGPPWRLQWDTTWVPDQPAASIKLIARVRDREGVWTVTQPVEGLSLARSDQRVVLYRASEVPERFGVRTGRKEACSIAIPSDAPLDRAGEAVLSLRTWHGWDGHHEPWRLNGQAFPIEGKNHHYDFDLLKVPTTLLRAGKNAFEIQSQTEHHMLEVLWPGPSLIVRYRK